MSKKDGGPAFPTGTTNGMSLRDYFAAKAMQAMIIAAGSRKWWQPIVGLNFSHICNMAYQMSDAMLSEKDK